MQELSSDSMSIRVYEFEESEQHDISSSLNYDPALDTNLTKEELDFILEDEYGGIIFARQEYSIKDGRSLGLEENKYYLYIKATDEFLDKAEKKFKHEFNTIKRLDPDSENKVIEKINKEESEVNLGVGSIFG